MTIFKCIAKIELLCRCARHIFNEYIQSVESHLLSTAIAHFLNLLFGCSAPNNAASTPQMNEMDYNSRKYNKKKRRVLMSGFVSSSNSPTPKTNAWTKLTQKDLWQQMAEDSASHFGLEIPAKNANEFFEWAAGSRRLAVLRRICTITGIQLVLKVVLKTIYIFKKLY
jgi:hypothetical protein